MADIEAFKNRIIECGYVLDPAGVHHEFVSGMHGQKLDFDNIEQKTDPLYNQWIDVAVEFIKEEFDPLPEVVLGVANGTNRVALSIARRIEGVHGLISEKETKNSKTLHLNHMAFTVIRGIRPAHLVVIEDVGTTGSNSVQVALEAKEAGAKEVEVVTTWKRRSQLERLDQAGIPHRAIIDHTLPTFLPQDCASDPAGFCARGWEFIERKK